MSTPPENDPGLARFRRGASARVDPPGPPPVVPAFAGDPAARDPAASDPAAGDVSAPPVPTRVDDVPSPRWGETAPPAPQQEAPTVQQAPQSPYGGIQPLFGDLVDRPGTVEPLYDEPDYDWRPDDADPGRGSGITALVIGVFVGIAGLIVGLVSVRTSRRAGRVGAWGLAAIVVSLISMAVVASIAVSYARYQVDLAQQCSKVGPGTYLTESGAQVTCG